MTWRPDIFLWECMYVVLKNYTAVRKQRKIIIICLLCWPPSRQPCNSYMAKKVHEVLALIWQRMSAHIFVEVLTLSILDVWLLIYFFLFDTPSKARDFFGIPFQSVILIAFVFLTILTPYICTFGVNSLFFTQISHGVSAIVPSTCPITSHIAARSAILQTKQKKSNHKKPKIVQRKVVSGFKVPNLHTSKPHGLQGKQFHRPYTRENQSWLLGPIKGPLSIGR